ncbi:hypothetical protein [Tenacibaculum maritimum]|uniref:hypothetical protein n=1 Tax=Tenacibaculum maritimum TaxID=107401 RepID=UPI0012E43A6B|nr:hypothetical protein [Tenacibaculum maritimum]CAA0244110.1 hypothetical protein NCIMB2158_630005 [Tenacibaculum maritimum]
MANGFKYKEGVIYSGAKFSRFDSNGAKFKDKTIEPMIDCIRVWAWYINTLGQLVEITAFQNHDSKITTANSKAGAVWLKFKVFNTVTLTSHFEWSYFDVGSEKAYLKKANIMICCRSKQKGGWCGHLSSDARKKFGENSRKHKNRK